MVSGEVFKSKPNYIDDLVRMLDPQVFVPIRKNVLGYCRYKILTLSPNKDR